MFIHNLDSKIVRVQYHPLIQLSCTNNKSYREVVDSTWIYVLSLPIFRDIKNTVLIVITTSSSYKSLGEE